MKKMILKWNRISAILLAAALVFDQGPLLYASVPEPGAVVSPLDGTPGDEDDETPKKGEYLLDEDMVMDIPDQSYTGMPIHPEPVVAYNGEVLTDGVDYTLDYGNNTNVGKNAGTVTIKGMGNYRTRPSIVKSFNIVKCNISTSPDIVITGAEDVAYSGGPVTPIHVFLCGVDVTGDQATVSYAKNNQIGTCKVTIKGTKNLMGKVTTSFRITQQDINDACIIAEPIVEQDYEEKFITPEVILRNTLTEQGNLVVDKDYTVTYKNNLLPTDEEHPALAIVKGIGNYKGMRTIPFQIAGMDISGLAIGVIPDQIYTGSAIEPEIIVTNGKRVLRKSVDYIVKYEDNVNVGRAKVTISGRTGTIYEHSSAATSFAITPADLGSASLINFGDLTYTGPKNYEQSKKMQVRMPNGHVLSPSEYEITYTNNYVAGDATVTASMTITSKSGNYIGKISNKEFRIIKGKKLLNDYTSEHISVRGFYSSRKYIYDTHDRRDNVDHSIYPQISVYYDDEELKKGTDYTVSYRNNNAIGTASVVITAVSTSAYSGTRIEDFYIVGRPIFALNEVDNPFNSLMPGDQAYTGKPICPKLNLRERIIKKNGDKVYSTLTQGVDYEVEYKDNVDIGEAKGIAYGIGNYSNDMDNTAEIKFNIVPRQMNDVTLPSIPDQPYTGSRICPDVYLMNTGSYMMEGKDYTVEYGENVNVGIGTIRVIAVDDNPNYEGEATIQFKIVPCNINTPSTVVEGLGVYRYAGEPVIPDIRLYIDGKLISEDEYVVRLTKNNQVGMAGVMIQARTGSSNYKGSIKTSFQIIGSDLGMDDRPPVVSYPYSGKNIKPIIPSLVNGAGATMVNGVDYKLKYVKKSAVGIHPIEVIGLRNFAKSTATIYYEITVCEVTSDILTIKPVKTMSLKRTYDARPPINIKVKGKTLKRGKDYVVTYLNNTSPGTGTCSIRFVGNYSGRASTTFQIVE